MPRPSHPEPHARKLLYLAETMWGEIKDYHHTMQFASEAEAVRRLLRVGLNVEQQRIARAQTRAGRRRNG